MKFRRKTLWRYIKQKQHKFFESYPFLGLFGTWNSSSNKQSSTTLKENGGHKTIIQEETFIGIDKWGHVKDKFRQVTWAWNSDIGQQKWWQMIQRWAETATATEKSAIKNNKISKSDMASSSICEMTGFERQGPYVTPLPPGGPHKSPLSYPWSNLTPVPFESPTFHLSSSY